MVEPIGTTIGAASLVLQLLDGCVKGPLDTAKAEQGTISGVLIRSQAINFSLRLLACQTIAAT